MQQRRSQSCLADDPGNSCPPNLQPSPRPHETVATRPLTPPTRRRRSPCPLFVSVGRPALPGFGPSFTGASPTPATRNGVRCICASTGPIESADRTIVNDRSDLTMANPSDDARVTEGARRGRFMTTSTAQSLIHVACSCQSCSPEEACRRSVHEPVCHFR